MKLYRRGVLFFGVFVALSAMQRLAEGVEFSTERMTSVLVTGCLATALFVALLHLLDE